MQGTVPNDDQNTNDLKRRLVEELGMTSDGAETLLREHEKAWRYTPVATFKIGGVDNYKGFAIISTKSPGWLSIGSDRDLDTYVRLSIIEYGSSYSNGVRVFSLNEHEIDDRQKAEHIRTFEMPLHGGSGSARLVVTEDGKEVSSIEVEGRISPKIIGLKQ